MKDYQNIDRYLNELSRDVYDQPEDEGHHDLADVAILWALETIWPGNVLDVGCGTGFCQPLFEDRRVKYEGVCLGDDYKVAQELGHNVKEMDYNFLDYPDETFHLIFARHALEHSPMPVISLMEWHRVALNWLMLMMPSPAYYTFTGRNHYSVAWPQQIVWWMRRAGWKLKRARLFHEEFWFLCEKKPIISYEGWSKAPIPHQLYEFERDKMNITGRDIVMKDDVGVQE